MTNPSRLWMQYLKWMLLTTLAIVATVGAFNTLIDPLGVFSSPRVVGLNAIKPYLDHHRELTRWNAAHRICPNAAIFGNSRAEIGFDPENPVFSKHGLSAFNHAIPGTGASMSYRQLNWLKTAGCMPKTIILGVEFFDFLGGTEAAKSVLAQVNAPQIDQRFLAESVFSITGLRDSLATIFLQRSRYPATLTERGFNPLHNYISEVEQSGHYVLFRQRASENARNWTRKPRRLNPIDGGISDDEQTVNAILKSATEAGSTVYVVIYPYHAEIRLLIERLQLADLFSDWKKQVVSIAARHLKQGSTVEVWDFSGISPESLESIPENGDRRTHLTHYWEAGHFKKALGDKIIARLLDDEGRLGIKLDLGNIDPWLQADRASIKRLMAQPSPLLAEVDNILQQSEKH
ncbi:MAG: hypothetical protein Q8S26_01300 [Azonexus sp.]|nr:hypothetical protein [Azonexus sp.]